ncbi:hypothetical protein STEG23_013396 [Scotinomys teguina]
MKFAGKWKELENIILSEVTQTQKDKHDNPGFCEFISATVMPDQNTAFHSTTSCGSPQRTTVYGLISILTQALQLIISLCLFLLGDFASSNSRAFSLDLVDLSIGESGVLKSPTINVWGLICVSCMQQKDGSCFRIHSVNLCLFIGWENFLQ